MRAAHRVRQGRGAPDPPRAQDAGGWATATATTIHLTLPGHETRRHQARRRERAAGARDRRRHPARSDQAGPGRPDPPRAGACRPRDPPRARHPLRHDAGQAQRRRQRAQQPAVGALLAGHGRLLPRAGRHRSPARAPGPRRLGAVELLQHRAHRAAFQVDKAADTVESRITDARERPSRSRSLTSARRSGATRPGLSTRPCGGARRRPCGRGWRRRGRATSCRRTAGPGAPLPPTTGRRGPRPATGRSGRA